jgi:hypothetical protein
LILVEIDGTLKDFKIIEGLNYMNVEALRCYLIAVMDSWQVDGKDDRVKFSIPITIK